jgi:IMP dehydrogenase/GMP reductase
VLSDQLLNFDDVLIEPVFSNVRSRKDVDVSTDFLGMKLSLPVISSNMDTVASPALCRALADYGAIGTLHRFWSIEENVQAFKDSISNGIKPIVSIGIGEKELERAHSLYHVGAEIFMLDVAHAANISVVEMYNQLLEHFCNPGSKVKFIVGDFGTGQEIVDFLEGVPREPDAVKVGIGIGSVCHTRNVTGVGNYSLSCLLDCSETLNQWENNIKLILDGGISEIGDISKALIAGTDMVMSGSLFAGTEETAGITILDEYGKKWKSYRGSASQESYVVQNKVAPWRCAEGTAILVPYKGPVVETLNSINGGLRSSCSYTNAFNLDELKANGEFQYKKIQVNV